MANVGSKSGLAIVLSKVKGFENPKVSAEQYITDSEVAASVLWEAFMSGDIKSESIIADFGCGTGILGIGALILGAKQVFFIDSDAEVVEIAKKNLEKVKSEGLIEGVAIFINSDITEFDKRIDVVIENPPFGVKVRHADKVFLEKAMDCAPVIWSLHKSESKKFISALSDDKGFEVSKEIQFDFPLKSTMEFHKRSIHRINVSAFRLCRKSKISEHPRN